MRALSRKRLLRRAVPPVFLVLAALTALTALTVLSPSWWERLMYPLHYRDEIAKYSRRNNLDPYVVAAVIQVESGFDAGSRSSAGARGLMQLLPKTGGWVAESLNESGYSDERLYDPETNIRYGTWYLSRLCKRYDSTLYALAAYNGGATNMDKWLRGREAHSEQENVSRIPFKETRQFVKRVVKMKSVYERLYPNAFEQR